MFYKKKTFAKMFLKNTRKHVQNISVGQVTSCI